MNRLDQATEETLMASMLEVVGKPSEAGCFEELAQQATHRLYADFSQSIVLTRTYVTVPFAALPAKNAAWVRSLAEAKGVASELSDETQVISLVGTAGRAPAWNDRCASQGHVGIPMTSASFIDAIPMMSRLMASLGGDLDWIDRRDTALVVSLLGTVAGTFYVPDAATETDVRGRKVISATDFVSEHRIKTVFGLGGAFATGQLLVTLVFCDELVPRRIVDGFQAPFLRFKSASAPLLRQVFRDGPATLPREQGQTPARIQGPAEEAREVPDLLAEKRRELETLNQLYLGLESQLEDRTRSLRLILDSTGDGMVLVDLDGTMYGERTRSLERWFGSPPAGQKIWEYLLGADSQARTFEQNFAQIADDVLPFELVADQMPKQFTRDGASFELSYKKVEKPQQPARVLLVVRDVTAQVSAERAAIRARELHAVVRNILRDQRGFDRFVEETSELLARILTTTDEVQQCRDLHTIKGNTAVLGFEAFPGLIHRIESRQVERGGLLDEEQLQSLRHGWSDALSMVADFMRRGDERIEISVHEHNDFLLQLLAGMDAEKLASIARGWRDEPAKNLLRRLGAQAERTAVTLDKSVQVSVADAGLRLPIGRTRDCWASLVHIVRNAVDHGIEPADSRVAAGKPAAGQIKLSCVTEANWLVVTISDDGRGVDWDAVRASAKRAALPSETYADLVEALFTDGCSTRSEASDVSGRGVGLPATRAAHRAIGGEVQLESVPGVGTVVRARMPLAERETHPG